MNPPKLGIEDLQFRQYANACERETLGLGQFDLFIYLRKGQPVINHQKRVQRIIKVVKITNRSLDYLVMTTNTRAS